MTEKYLRYENLLYTAIVAGQLQPNEVAVAAERGK